MQSGLKCEVKEGKVKIGNTSANIYQPVVDSKVPDTLFYDINQVG